MKTTKKAVSVLLEVLLIALTVPFAFAAGGTEGDLTWTYDAAQKP